MLHLIVSPDGKSMSDKIFENAKSSIFAGRESFIIVPEQNTVDSEIRLLKECGEKANLFCEVINLSRLPNRIFRETGGISGEYLTKAGKALLISKVLSELSDYLTVYKDAAKSYDFPMRLVECLDGLKSSGLGTAAIKEAARNAGYDGNTQLIGKLSELYLIASAFDEEAKNFCTLEDDITKLNSILDEFDFFSGKDVYADGFFGFSLPQLELIKHIIAQADNFYITINCYPEAIEATEKCDAFSSSIKLYSKLLRFSESAGQQAKTDFIKRGNTSFFSQIDENALLQRSSSHVLFSETSADALRITECASEYDEIIYCAHEIEKLVRYDGIRYSDIAVVYRSETPYGALCDMIFEKYSIPTFHTQKSKINAAPLVQAIILSVEIAAGDTRLDTMRAYMKTGFIQLSQDELFLLEDYALSWSISGSKWFTGDFKMNPSGYTSEMTESDSERLTRVNLARQKLIAPLYKLKQNISSTRSVSGKLDAVTSFLIDVGAYEIIARQSEILISEKLFSDAGELILLWNTVVSCMTQFNNILGDYEPKGNFISMLRLCFSDASTGRIPSVSDAVSAGESEFIRYDGVKYLFAPGFNADLFPASKQSDGFFTGLELEELQRIMPDADLIPDMTDSDELFLFHRIISAPREKLYITYHSSSSSDDSYCAKSPFIPVLMRTLPSLSLDKFNPDSALPVCPEEAFSALCAGMFDDEGKNKLLSAVSITDKSFTDRFARADGRCDPLRSLSHEYNPYISAPFINLTQSRIQSYNQCKYSYFLKYLLSAKPKKNMAFDYSEVGTYIHAILEKFFVNVFESGESLETLDRKEIMSRIRHLSEEHLGSLGGGGISEARLLHMTSRISDASVRVVEKLICEFKGSKFIPVLFESDLSETDSAYRVGAEKHSLQIFGKIDRADIYKSENGEYFIRVVDYKTSGKAFSISDIYNGINLQLLVYLFALCQNGVKLGEKGDGVRVPVNPAGLIYVKALSSDSLSDQPVSDEDAETKASKLLKNDGLIIDDKELIYAMDPAVSGSFIPVKFNKDGSISSYSKVISKENYSILKKHVDRILKKTADDLLRGDFTADPFADKKLSCEYCGFKCVCRNESDGGREFKKFDKISDVLAEIKKEEEV
ncbi:MAG: PD-(D/E)XK nuclease family protein [Oscillospiraceae bacterium]|nr:PD-(D/E)XK nuclease family protein [Oscillospiraceae bacterium]